MKKEYFNKHFKKGKLKGCFPINLNKIGFIHQDQSERDNDHKKIGDFPTRLIAYLPQKIESGLFGTLTWDSGIDNLFLCANKLDWIIETDVFVISEITPKTNWYPIPNNEKGQLAKGMINIEGDVYAYGMSRSVFKYTGVKQWENITARSKHPNLSADLTSTNDRFIGDRIGFSAMDGFNQNDIYAGGNKGDCWHFDGTSWRKKDLPINSDISAITCAPNGMVYISCRLGPILVGRDDDWQILDDNKQIK